MYQKKFYFIHITLELLPYNETKRNKMGQIKMNWRKKEKMKMKKKSFSSSARS